MARAAADPTRARRAATWIVQRLADAGHTAYFAGGCVRDALLGLHPTDFDVATDATPPRVRALFPRTAEVGAAFGVVLVHVPADHPALAADAPAPPSQQSSGGAPPARTTDPTGVTVEVATFRADGPYSDARRPDSVRFSDPLADAQRRDFTINALFLDPLAPPDPAAAPPPSPAPDLHGRIIDHVGGVNDLRGRVLRAVGDPDQRLAEDHLRALRAVRFAARLGFTLDPATAAAVARHAADLRGVSRERIGDELRRMLAHPARAAALTLLQSLALDTPILGDAAGPAPLPLTAALPPAADVPTALAAWATDRATAALPAAAHPTWLSDADTTALIRRWRPALCLSNDETDALRGTLDAVRAAQALTTLPVAARKRAASKPRFPNGLQIVRAWSPPVADLIQGEVDRLAADGVGLAPPPALTGDDLVAAGWTPGPSFKAVLEQVYDAQLEGRVSGKHDALELASRLHV